MLGPAGLGVEYSAMELNEHSLEQILTRQREEYQRYMGVHVEGLRSQIQLAAEAKQA